MNPGSTQVYDNIAIHRTKREEVKVACLNLGSVSLFVVDSIESIVSLDGGRGTVAISTALELT
jgi:hypothetical protein